MSLSNGSQLTRQTQKKKHRGLGPSFRRIFRLTLKEMRVLISDKLAMFLLVIFPITMLLLANYGSYTGTGGEVISESARFGTPIIGIADFDNSEGLPDTDLSAELYAIFKEFETAGECLLHEGLTRNQYEQELGQGQINGYVILEDGFEFNISTHFVGMFTVVLDSYDIFITGDVVSLIDDIIEIFQDRFEIHGAIDIVIQEVNIPERAGTLVMMAPYFYPIMAYAMPILIVSQSLIGDIPKDRLLLTPTNKREIILAKLFGGAIICSSLPLIMTVMSVMFGLQIKVSIAMFFLVNEICTLVAVANGLFISSISDTTLAGFQYSLLTFIVQEVIMLFVTNVPLLSTFPLYTSQEILAKVVFKGDPLLSGKGLLQIPFFTMLLFECIISVILAYIVYKRKKTVI